MFQVELWSIIQMNTLENVWKLLETFLPKKVTFLHQSILLPHWGKIVFSITLLLFFVCHRGKSYGVGTTWWYKWHTWWQNLFFLWVNYPLIARYSFSTNCAFFPAMHYALWESGLRVYANARVYDFLKGSCSLCHGASCRIKTLYCKV